MWMRLLVLAIVGLFLLAMSEQRSDRSIFARDRSTVRVMGITVFRQVHDAPATAWIEGLVPGYPESWFFMGSVSFGGGFSCGGSGGSRIRLLEQLYTVRADPQTAAIARRLLAGPPDPDKATTRSVMDHVLAARDAGGGGPDPAPLTPTSR